MTSDPEEEQEADLRHMDRDGETPSRADLGSKVWRGEWIEAGGRRLQGRSSSSLSGKRRRPGAKEPCWYQVGTGEAGG